MPDKDKKSDSTHLHPDMPKAHNGEPTGAHITPTERHEIKNKFDHNDMDVNDTTDTQGKKAVSDYVKSYK